MAFIGFRLLGFIWAAGWKRARSRICRFPSLVLIIALVETIAVSFSFEYGIDAKVRKTEDRMMEKIDVILSGKINNYAQWFT